VSGAAAGVAAEEACVASRHAISLEVLVPLEPTWPANNAGCLSAGNLSYRIWFLFQPAGEIGSVSSESGTRSMAVPGSQGAPKSSQHDTYRCLYCLTGRPLQGDVGNR
jgi:hypothetical protein